MRLHPFTGRDPPECIFCYPLSLYLTLPFQRSEKEELHLSVNMWGIFNYEQDDPFIRVTSKGFYFTRICFIDLFYFRVLHFSCGTRLCHNLYVYVGFTTDDHGACVISPCDYHGQERNIQ